MKSVNQRRRFVNLTGLVSIEKWKTTTLFSSAEIALYFTET